MLTALLAFVTLGSQEIPKGVRYKKADAKVNAIAEKKLHAVFDKKPTLADYAPVSSTPLVIGPSLWAAIKKAVVKEFANSKPVTFFVPGSAGVQKLEGRSPKTAKQLETTWMCIAGLAEKSGKATVRKAKANELSYYWALIPYDIEEPLYMVDCGRTKFVIDFSAANPKDPKPFFVDIVGSMSK